MCSQTLRDVLSLHSPIEQIAPAGTQGRGGSVAIFFVDRAGIKIQGRKAQKREAQKRDMRFL